MTVDHDHYSDAYIRQVLDSVTSVAVVGASGNPARPSYLVVKYLLSKEFKVFPVNPGRAGTEIADVLCHESLSSLPEPMDMIDIFRSPEAAGAVVDEALTLDPLPKVIWMQLGVRNDAAAARAEERGVRVVMNRCPKIEYARLCGKYFANYLSFERIGPSCWILAAWEF